MPAGGFLLGDFLRQNRACAGRVEFSQARSGSADRGVDIRPIIRAFNRLLRSGENRLDRLGGARADFIECQPALPEMLEQREQHLGIDALFASHRFQQFAMPALVVGL